MKTALIFMAGAMAPVIVYFMYGLAYMMIVPYESW